MISIHRIHASGFRSLREMDLRLGGLNVLVGPNGAGKSTVLEIIQFLGDVARSDLGPAIDARGGFEALAFRGEPALKRPVVRVGVEAQVTRYASDNARDEYELTFGKTRSVLVRSETFKFKRTQGQGRRIQVKGSKVEIYDEKRQKRERDLASNSAALSTLQRLGEKEGASQVRELAELFEGFRVLDVNVGKARLPAAFDLDERPTLRPDASNLAEYLYWLKQRESETFALLVDDICDIVPGLRGLHFEPIGGATEAVKLTLEERALRGRTDLAHASFGTVRALAVLAALHDPHPPRLTCIEEIDHGLHPHALDRIVERLRSATARTQLLLATHSPALVNRLQPDELIVCERDPETGASRVPAITRAEVREICAQDDLGLGELWFSGTLGGAL